MNSLKRRLDQGDPLFGSWINTASPIVAELMAAVGFDFLVVDAEHSAVNVSDVQRLSQAISAGEESCTPLVRLARPEYWHTKKMMDAGVGGVIAPMISSAQEASAVVAAVKYPPGGNRGVGFARSNTYGLDLESALANDNDRSFVCVQIETASGVRDIDEILATDGVDAILIGPYDLSASLGVTAQFDHPVYVEALDTILNACNRHQVAPGIHIVQPDPTEVSRRLQEGYRLIGYSLDITLLSHSAREGLQVFRDLVASQP